MARKAGLTDHDLRTMTYAQVDSWIELYQWSNYVPDHDEEKGEGHEEHMAARAGQSAFFHLT